jgi:hypothetical protein
LAKRERRREHIARALNFNGGALYDWICNIAFLSRQPGAKDILDPLAWWANALKEDKLATAA